MIAFVEPTCADKKVNYFYQGSNYNCETLDKLNFLQRLNMVIGLSRGTFVWTTTVCEEVTHMRWGIEILVFRNILQMYKMNVPFCKDTLASNHFSPLLAYVVSSCCLEMSRCLAMF